MMVCRFAAVAALTSITTGAWSETWTKQGVLVAPTFAADRGSTYEPDARLSVDGTKVRVWFGIGELSLTAGMPASDQKCGVGYGEAPVNGDGTLGAFVTLKEPVIGYGAGGIEFACRKVVVPLPDGTFNILYTDSANGGIRAAHVDADGYSNPVKVAPAVAPPSLLPCCGIVTSYGGVFTYVFNTAALPWPYGAMTASSRDGYVWTINPQAVPWITDPRPGVTVADASPHWIIPMPGTGRPLYQAWSNSGPAGLNLGRQSSPDMLHWYDCHLGQPIMTPTIPADYGQVGDASVVQLGDGKLVMLYDGSQNPANITSSQILYATNPGPLSALACSGQGNDEFTVLMLHLDADLSDSGASGGAHAFTAHGGAGLTNKLFQFGGGALLLTSAGQWIDTPDVPDLYQAGDYAISAWVRADAVGGYLGAVFTKPTSVGFSPYKIVLDVDGAYKFLTSPGGWNTSKAFGPAVAANTWHHIEVSKCGADHYLFQDGTLGLIWNNGATPITSPNGVRIGADISGQNFIGSIDEVRFDKVCRHTASFPLPSGPYQ